MSETPALSVRGLARRHRAGLRATTALDGVDLDLAPGAFLGLLGPNGSGKSTLLRLAAGVDAPTAGTVRVFGADPRGAAPRMRIGWVPEGCPFPLELSGGQVLRLLGRLRGVTDRARTEAMLERVGLADAARRALGRYSSGMRRRFALAQAFLHEPDLLLLDEPSVGLDAEGFALLESLLAEARARGAAAVVCSHQTGDLFGRCEEVAVLVDGKLALRGTTEAIALEVAAVEAELETSGDAPLDAEALRAALAERGVALRGLRPATAALRELYARAAGRSGA